MANILLVEPNSVLARMYRLALQEAGHVVVTAQSAQEAIHGADTRGPDVVVMELQLAGHDGIEFLHEFRSYSEWQEVPVLLVTNTPPSVLRPYHEVFRRDLGVRVCLYKPRLSLERLVKAVEGQLA